MAGANPPVPDGWPPARKTSPLPGNVTVDGTTGGASDPDLTYAQNTNPPAGRRNFSRAGALDILRGGDEEKVIVGFGFPTMIVTGSGSAYNDSDKYIAASNHDDWVDEVKQLQPCKSLALYACQVASGDQGIAFINSLRDAIGGDTEVWAPDGLLHVDQQGRFRLEDGARWVVSRKDQPAKHDQTTFAAFWWHPQKIASVPAGPPKDSRESVGVAHLDLRGTVIVPEPSTYQFVLNGRTATTYFRGLIRSQPLTVKDGPLAVTTAVIDVTFEDGVRMSYEILNDVLMHTPYDRNVYYRITAPLGAGLGTI
jgi:hypothetical protein